MRTRNRFIFIVSYGIFLGFVLSFIYSGVIFAKFRMAYEYKEIYFALLFLSATLSCLITFIFNVRINKKVLGALMIFDIILFFIFYYIINVLPYSMFLTLSYIITFVIGFINMSISNVFLMNAKQYNDYADIFVNTAVVMAIANLFAHSVNVLMSYDYNNLPIILGFIFIIFDVFLLIKLDFVDNKENIGHGGINTKALCILGLVVFLLKISEGLMYQIVNDYIIAFHSDYKLIYMIPYFLAVVLCLLISYRISKKLLFFLFICIGIMASALVLLLISEEFAEMSSSMLHFGVGVSDVLIWGIIIYFIYIYKDAHKIVSFLMFFQILGMFSGYMMYEIEIYNFRPAYIIALFALAFSAVLLGGVKEITMEDLLLKKDLIFQNRYMLSGLQAGKKSPLNYMEKQVYEYIVDKKTDSEIAYKLNISVVEVETYFNSICIKLGVKSRSELRDLVVDSRLIV